MQQNKTKYLEIFVTFILIFNSACKSDLTDLSTGNYYESSTVKRWNLKGKVKSVSINNDDQVYEFNKEGFVTKITVNQYGSILINEYNYNSSGKLQNIITYFQNQPQYKNTEIYTYDSSNRLVLKHPNRLVTNFSAFNMNEIINDLVSGLKSVTNNASDYNYYFVNDTLYLCRKATINNTLINDTTKVTYNGKYPVSYTVLNPLYNIKIIYKDIVFSNIGNLLRFTEVRTDSNSNIYKQTFYYKPDYPCMLLDSVADENGTNRQVEKYIYNSKMDLYKQIGDNIEWENDYKYDSHGNWIKQTIKSRSNNSANWENGSTTTRVIKYW